MKFQTRFRMSTHRFKSTSPLGALLIRAALMLALCLLAVSTSAPVSAQQSERTITGLTLSSEEPGELAVSWDAASPAPVDYRVSWARSDEDYRTWTDDSGNAYPTTNSLTLTGLDEGVEYKVQVRARYGNLSGPWSDEARLTVAGADGAPSPTPEPTPEPIAPDPSDADLAPRNLTVSQVNGWARLSWEEPVADADSVTGYEILRRRPGRGEAELRTLVADTDSTETVYEDRTANEPGVLYAYRVKALRGAVKSVQSNFVNFVSAGDAPGSPAGVPRLLMEGEMRVGYVRDELWERLTDIYGYSLYTGVGELIVSWHVPDDQQFTVGALGHTADVEDGTGALHFGVSRWLEYPFVLGVGDRALSSRQALRIDGGPPLYRWSGGCSDWTEGQTVPVSVRRVSEDDPLYTQSMDDASLGVLSVEGDELSPAFTPETLSYHADVGWEVESVKVVAEASAAGSCGVEFSPEQDAGGRIDLSEGENLIEVTVTAADGETMSTYAVLIRRAEAPYEDGAGLSGLRMSEVPGLEFEPQRQRYTVEVPERTDQTTVSALGSESGTRVEVVAVRAGEPLAFDGTDEDPGSGGHQVRLSGSGETLLLVRAESEDGARLRLYSLNLRQAESTSGARSSAVLKRDNRAGGSSVRAPRNQGGTGPRLSSLSLGSVALSPTFSAETFAYEASVGHDVGVVTVSAVPASGGTLIISPPDADADADGWQVNLSASMPGGDPAQTLIIVVVRSADGTRLESYVITVTRAAPPSDDASLSSLSIGGLELTPAFGPDVLEYEARVDSDTAVVTVSANTAHADATYVVSPEESADEEATPGYQVELAEGENTITITVTAKDGVTTKTYTVTVNRAGPPSSDARLRTLSLAEAELTPAFSPDTSVYAAAVGWQVTRVTVTLEANESDARLAVSPPDADPAGGYQLDLPVAEPDGTAESVVLVVASTAPDGVGRQTYLLTVTRDARPSDDDASLSGLSLEGLELMPAFDSETLVYEATAPDEAESITVTATATASDAGATVTIAPVDADPDTDDNQVKLTRRSNPVNITVTVTAPDGVTTQNYTVAVHHNFGRGGFVQVDAGWDYACGLRVDGTLTCWQIMLDPRLRLRPVPEGTFTQVMQGNLFGCGVTTDGSVECWDDDEQRIGMVSDAQDTPAVAVHAHSGWYGCRLNMDGSAECGYPLSLRQHINFEVSGPYQTVVAGKSFGCGLDMNGRIDCWRSVKDRLDPPNPDTEYSFIGAGGYRVCGIKAEDSSVSCWRWYYGPETPYGTWRVPNNSYQIESTPSGEFTFVDSSYEAACGVKVGGDVVCWGYDRADELTRNAPDGEFATVTIDWYRACGLQTDGTAVCWARSFTPDINDVLDKRLPSPLSPWRDNPDLLGLELSGVSLSPRFNRNVIEYTASVGDEVNSITVSPELTNTLATYSIASDADAQAADGEVDLAVGENLITVTVTSADRSATKTYTVTVTRAAQ